MVEPMGGFAYTWPILIAALAGYLLGSIPFGLVLTRLAGYGDIRKIGSGNIGATNVLRTGNKPLALATLVLDSGKGALAVLIAQAIGGTDMAIVAGAGAMLGHSFPVWLKFKGGKGVATALGTLLAVSWPLGLFACATWLLTAAIFRISSLAALAALAATTLVAFYVGTQTAWLPSVTLQVAELCLFIAVLVFIRHHANIRRLLRGQEPRIGASKKAG